MEQSIQEQWNEILNYIINEFNVSSVSFDTWLKPLRVAEVDGDLITLVFDNEKDSFFGQQQLDYVKNKYHTFIKAAIGEIAHSDYDVEYMLLSQYKEAMQKKEAAAAAVSSSGKSTNYATDVKRVSLNPKYTFDTFVVASNNNFAHAAALAVAESPGEVYNPLFIYGGVGLGKTHLMHSIAHFILDNNPNADVLYVTSEKFTNELIDAIRSGNNNANKITAFRERYRNKDVLLIDDIQFIIGKESTQEEFFHTFNELYSAKKQIIISSDKPPKDMATLEERLRSRFECGLTVDIQNPNYEARMAILRKKEDLENYKIGDDIIKYIADNVKSNIRELEGALNKVVALSKLKKTPITKELAEEALKDLISPDDKRPITLELIVNIVSEHFGISPAEIYSPNRSKNIAYPRQICMYLCRKFVGLSLTDIGKLLGNRDHSTVLHGCNTIERNLDGDPSLQSTIDILTKKINPQI